MGARLHNVAAGNRHLKSSRSGCRMGEYTNVKLASMYLCIIDCTDEALCAYTRNH